MGNTSITRLTDRELLNRTEELTRKERKLTLAVIDHLIEVERRRLYADCGHRSLFAYCTDELGYSGSAAHRRISAARAIRRFPKIRRLLEERKLTLSTLAVVAKLLRPENVDEVLKEICGKSAKEAEAVGASYGIVVRPRERIGVVAVSRHAREKAVDASPSQAVPGLQAPASKGVPTEPTPASPPAAAAGANGVRRGSGAPGEHFRRGSKTAQPDIDKQDTKKRFALERKYTFEFAGSEAFMKKYQKAVALLSNRLGGRVTIEGVFEALLDDYIGRHDPECRKRRREDKARRQHGRRPAERAGQRAHPVTEACGTTIVEPAAQRRAQAPT